MKLFTKPVENAIEKTPFYSQDGKKGEAKVIARFFLQNCTWYVLEGNNATGELYGLVDMGYGFEYGYFDRRQLETVRGAWGLGVERDLSIKPLKMTVAECMTMYGETFDL